LCAHIEAVKVVLRLNLAKFINFTGRSLVDFIEFGDFRFSEEAFNDFADYWHHFLVVLSEHCKGIAALDSLERFLCCW